MNTQNYSSLNNSSSDNNGTSQSQTQIINRDEEPIIEDVPLKNTNNDTKNNLNISTDTQQTTQNTQPNTPTDKSEKLKIDDNSNTNQNTNINKQIEHKDKKSFSNIFKDPFFDDALEDLFNFDLPLFNKIEERFDKIRRKIEKDFSKLAVSDNKMITHENQNQNKQDTHKQDVNKDNKMIVDDNKDNSNNQQNNIEQKNNKSVAHNPPKCHSCHCHMIPPRHNHLTRFAPIFRDPLFTPALEDLFDRDFLSFNRIAKQFDYLKRKMLRDVNNVIHNRHMLHNHGGKNNENELIESQHPATCISKSFYKTSGSDPNSNKMISEERITRIDDKGRKFTEKKKTYENLKDNIRTETHSRLIDGKGITEVKTRKIYSNDVKEEKKLKYLKEEELSQFDQEFETGFKRENKQLKIGPTKQK